MYAAAICSVILAVALVLLAIFGSVSRKAHVPGVLVPRGGALSVQAPVSGTVTEVHFSEGQHIAAGALLLDIDSDRVSSSEGSLRKTNAEVVEIIHKRLSAFHEQRAVHQRAFDERDTAFLVRIRLIEEQIQQARTEENLLARRVHFAAESLARQEALGRTGFVSAVQVQAKADEHLDAEARLQAARRVVTSLKADRASVEADRVSAASQRDAQLAEVTRSENLLQQELLESAARGKAAVTAPTTGVISAAEVISGNAVKAGQTLLTIIRTDGTARSDRPALIAHLFAPSRSAGFVREGQRVQLRLGAFPFQKFGFISGRVGKVSKTPFTLAELPPAAAALISGIGPLDGGVFRVVVEIETEPADSGITLKAGDTLEADIVLETRAIWEWMFEPLIRLRRLT